MNGRAEERDSANVNASLRPERRGGAGLNLVVRGDGDRDFQVHRGLLAYHSILFPTAFNSVPGREIQLGVRSVEALIYVRARYNMAP